MDLPLNSEEGAAWQCHKGLRYGDTRAEAGRGSTRHSARQSGDCKCHQHQLGRDRRRSVVGRKWQQGGCHNATLAAAPSQKNCKVIMAA